MDRLELIDRSPVTNREKEVFRTLRTNIEFTGIENRIIAVTSCTPDDGKTTVSFQLACAFAENGKKTLYIDADLRKSVFIQRFNIKGKPIGLCHYLSGQSSVLEAMYKTNIDHLYVMPVGAYPTNPTELLSKDRFPQMLAELKKAFDYVIIDTPPLASVVDAAVIAKQSDASMLVLAADNSSRKIVKDVVNRLKMANPNFLGVVLNKVHIKNSFYGKYYGAYYGTEDI